MSRIIGQGHTGESRSRFRGQGLTGGSMSLIIGQGHTSESKVTISKSRSYRWVNVAKYRLRVKVIIPAESRTQIHGQGSRSSSQLSQGHHVCTCAAVKTLDSTPLV